MRWPLRHQILLPMVGLMLAALAGVSVLNACWSVRRTRSRIERELAQVAETLMTSRFPLTDGVLRQMKGLAGAEFVLTDPRGALVASSAGPAGFRRLPAIAPLDDDARLTLAQSIVVGERRYFHCAVAVGRRAESWPGAALHILYPEDSYRQAWRDVVYPPLIVGGAAIVLVIGASLGVALRVTRPLGRLQRQVDEIAMGAFRSLPVPDRDDEITDLSRSINRMAEMLAQYETDVRRNEQLRTLGQLGGGMAHQIRNAVTGCRLAVELHSRGCRHEREGLDVAMRQLELMEKFLRRFLSLGRSDAKPHAAVRLQPIVENVISLVGPTARHLGVALEWRLPDQIVETFGDADALEQLLVNLVLNGVEAASQQLAPRHGAAPSVCVRLRRLADRVEMEIEDTGGGPAAEVESTLFEPFVTEKPDGTGLGLAVAKEIAAAHNGDIHWRRCEAATCFVVDLPIAPIAPSTPESTP